MGAEEQVEPRSWESLPGTPCGGSDSWWDEGSGKSSGRGLGDLVGWCWDTECSQLSNGGQMPRRASLLTHHKVGDSKVGDSQVPEAQGDWCSLFCLQALQRGDSDHVQHHREDRRGLRGPG